MRRFALVLLGCLALGSLPLVIATRTPPPAAALESQPNIILIVTDDQTMDTMAALAELERNDSWWTFNNAFINSPLCCPSRANILSGQFAHHTGVERIPEDKFFDDTQTVATWLQKAGYRTGIFGKYFNRYPWSSGPRAGQTYRPPGWNKIHIFGSVPKYLPAQNEAILAGCSNAS
jgi:arylsulfatase A-like enzyme